jgi:hypothetical protein
MAVDGCLAGPRYRLAEILGPQGHTDKALELLREELNWMCRMQMFL